ncbi:MAG: M56 family metallopeptidase [Thermincola sp.]|jgi:Zn-dependent protease with chaperone function|nr:M56 family metallopeptidase [Thermincola sp.]MDT3703844.1 M56 family metallopeptidase [Thermincola sp.]
MFYRQIIDNYVHPFIIYVLLGTLISYILCRILIRAGLFGSAKWRAMVYIVPFIVPFAAYLLPKPLLLNRCFTFGQQPELVTSWLCTGGSVLAAILTPLFLASVVFAIFRAIFSIAACRRFIKTYGYANRAANLRIFLLLEPLCSRAQIKVPKIVVTANRFARAFTMGFRDEVIVLSQGLINNLDDEELETVLAHELGHIVRKDSLSNWIIVFFRDIMFFTPLIFFVFRDYASEKEKATDDYAIQLTGKPMAFAQALIKVWKMSPGNAIEDSFPYPAFISHAGILDQRVERLVEGDFCVLSHRLFSPLAFSGLVIISIAFLFYLC